MIFSYGIVLPCKHRNKGAEIPCNVPCASKKCLTCSLSTANIKMFFRMGEASLMKSERFCMKRIVKSAVVTMLAAAVFVVFGACTAPTQPLEESLYCAKERAIEVYLTQHQKAVDNYAHAMSMIFRMFYNETGMCKTQFEWLRSRGELPTLTQAPYDGFQLQDFARQESSGFRLIRNSILKSFLINKGLFGRFTTDVRWDLYVLHEGDVFFIIRLEEDFREALLLLLDFHGRGGRSVFALGPIVSRDEFGRQQHFGPLTWPVLDWGSPRTVVFFYYICEWYAPVTQDASLS